MHLPCYVPYSVSAQCQNHIHVIVPTSEPIDSRTVYAVHLVVVLIWRFGKFSFDCQTYCTTLATYNHVYYE